ncbi:MAG: aldo/keto reductase [Ahrensia sp.]|nr:aldo/keto reductase [Ahrensia sp.]
MKTAEFQRGNTRLTFTELGMGTAPLGNLYKAVSEDEAQETLDKAWDVGCRYYDTAPLYGLGLAETRMNRFLRNKPRDDYVLSTKIGRLLLPCAPDDRTGIGKFFETPTRREFFDYSYNGVMRSFEFSLERLGVDRVDILFAHDLDIFNQGSREVMEARMTDFFASGFRALSDLRDQGVVKAIGAGINEWQAAQILLENCDMDLFLLAGRYTLLEQEALNSFLPLCEERGVGIVLGGPYNSGILASGPVPGAYYNYEPAPQEILDRVARIEAVCQSHGVALIEAALRFPLFHPCVLSTIPGAQSVAEVENNAKTIATDIPEALWADLKAEGLLRADARTP